MSRKEDSKLSNSLVLTRPRVLINYIVQIHEYAKNW